MGTFHNDRHELHGITVVVDTDGAEIYVGVCEDVTDSQVFLRDADVHREGDSETSKDSWVEKAARFGVWGKLGHVVLPRGRVRSIRRLGDVPADPATAPGR